ELLVEALALGAHQRAGFLDAACAGDPSLRAAVEELLRFDDAASPALEPLPPSMFAAFAAAPTTADASDAEIQRIGRIRIDGLLGEGGMGRVYSGFDELLERKVALKMIHPGRELSEEVRARFLREARVLSRLD